MNAASLNVDFSVAPSRERAPARDRQIERELEASIRLAHRLGPLSSRRNFQQPLPREHREQVWTEERVATLTVLWRDGYACSQIADHLGAGLTASAVIGKAHRLGLTHRRPLGQLRAARPPANEAARARRVVYRARYAKRLRRIFLDRIEFARRRGIDIGGAQVLAGVTRYLGGAA